MLRRRAVVGAMLGAIATPSVLRAQTQRPNIVLVVSDDQFKSTLDLGMPKTRARNDLLWYDNGCATGLVCAAARASLLTGQYDFHHGVTNNLVSNRFDAKNWLLAWAKAAGYVTGYYGKLINNYPWGLPVSRAVPACADWWQVFHDQAPGTGGYYMIERRGPDAAPQLYFYSTSNPDNCSTDLLTARALLFLKRYAGQHPFFLIVAPYAPHDGSVTPARYADAFAGTDMASLRPSSFNIVGLRQPPWLRSQPLADPEATDESRREALRSCLTLDDLADRLLRGLGAAGVLDQTVFAFTTDQGIAMGEHRLVGKHNPYGSTTDVPFAMRWPGGKGGATTQLVTHVDLTATLCAVAGLTPGLPPDGGDIRTDVRSDVILHWAGGDNGGRNSGADYVPSFWGLRTPSFKYVRLDSGFKELYALPGNEVDNLSGLPAYANVQSQLTQRLAAQLP